jgi:uncharacterized protein
VRITALYAYPVKSCAAVSLEAAEVDALGLQPDRRFALVGAAGEVLTQRDCPRLAAVRPALDASTLRLDLAGLGELAIALDAFQERLSARVWGARLACRAAPALRELDDYAGARVRVVALEAGATRGFEDAAPVLVASLAALKAVNAVLARPVGMERFRPNVVLDEEAQWQAIDAAEAVLERIEPCERCEVIAIDQASGERGPDEPLQVLNAAYSGTFGVYARVARAGRLRRGEALRFRAGRAPR